jgi:hypothetical protein
MDPLANIPARPDCLAVTNKCATLGSYVDLPVVVGAPWLAKGEVAGGRACTRSVARCLGAAE